MANRRKQNSVSDSLETENTRRTATKPHDFTQTMSMDDKLALLDEEIRAVHEYCASRGLSAAQVARAAEPLLSAVTAARRRRLALFAAKLAAGFVLVGVLLMVNPVNKMLTAGGRMASMQVLPYWDWSKLYNAPCLIANPYYAGRTLLEEDCELCENLEMIDRVANVSHAKMTEDYLKREIPVIVTDATADWPALKKFSLHFLHELYSKEATLAEIMPCMFASNVRVRNNNPKMVLGKGTRGEITNWYSHWENCEKTAAKTLRQFYSRPYFLPAMVGMAESNWLFVASHYKGKKHKPADIAFPMMYMAQVKGSTKIAVTPRDPCATHCQKLYATLHEGDILVVTDMMWLLDYLPLDNPETIAIGAGGFFD